MRKAVRTGIVASVGVVVLTLAICMVVRWLKGPQIGQLYVLGVTADQRGIGIRSAVVIWCLAVPFSVALIATRAARYRRSRGHRSVDRHA